MSTYTESNYVSAVLDDSVIAVIIEHWFRICNIHYIIPNELINLIKIFSNKLWITTENTDRFSSPYAFCTEDKRLIILI